MVIMNFMSQHDLIGVAEAAKVADRSIATIKRAVRRGELVPVIKMPGATGAYLLNRSDVERFAVERAA